MFETDMENEFDYEGVVVVVLLLLVGLYPSSKITGLPPD